MLGQDSKQKMMPVLLLIMTYSNNAVMINVKTAENVSLIKRESGCARRNFDGLLGNSK